MKIFPRSQLPGAAFGVVVILAGGMLAGCASAPSANGLGLRPPHTGDEELRETNAAARQQDFVARRAASGANEFSPDVWMRGEAAMQSMATHVPGVGVIRPGDAGESHAKAAHEWQWIGPSNVPGRMRTLAFHPQNPDVLFAGGVSGGVWRSEDRGDNWAPLADDAVNLNIGALLIDASRPEVMYAGTGELYRNSAMPWSPMAGAGILKSSDGGRSWHRLDATATADFRYVSDLVASPHDPRRIYAATNSGIWRSDDAGISFTQVLRPVDGLDRLAYEGCNDLAIRSDSTGDWVLAACSSRSTDDRYWLPGSVTPPACGAPCAAAIFVNTDAAGAGVWNQTLSEVGQGRTQMDIHRANTLVVYASAASIVPGPDRTGDGVGDYDNGLHAVFRSNDGGLSWTATVRNTDATKLNTTLLSHASGAFARSCFNDPFDDWYGAGWYNHTIAVDPVNPDTVWVGGMDIYRSDDGGRNFGLASWWWAFEGRPGFVHSDQHLLRFDPRFDGVNNRRIYSTNDGGVAVSENARAAVAFGSDAPCQPRDNQIAWRKVSGNLGSTQFYSGAVSPHDGRAIGGTQDNGTQLSPADPTRTDFLHVLGGDGGNVAFDPAAPGTVYASSQNVSIWRSDNFGQSFLRMVNGINDTPVFIMPWILDINQSSRLYAAGTRVWRTDNRGGNWRAVSTPLGGSAFGNRASAIAVAPGAPNRMLVGNQIGIFRNDAALSAGSNTNWNPRTPRTGWVSSLTFQNGNPDTAWATYSSVGGVHVWRTLDGGNSWSSRDGAGAGALPDIPVHSLVIDPADSSRVYIGTDLGIFFSPDAGATWTVENTGFANVIVERLALGPPQILNGPPMLHAFTYGRGIWKTPLSFEGANDYRMDARVSGLWYDPAQNGQGVNVEIIDQEGVPKVAVFWFTYRDGKSLWIYGSGDFSGDRTQPIKVFETSGPDFPPSFDVADFHQMEWGEVSLVYTSDSAATFAWRSTDNSAVGSMPLVPLTRLRDIAADMQSDGRPACMSGTWYNPDQSGHGLQVQIIGNTGGDPAMSVIWFAFGNGQPLFLIGSADADATGARVLMQRPTGAQFPPAFSPADVVREPWGEIDFRFTSANSAHVTWTPTLAGFSAGEMDLVRLTSIRGQSCQ